MPFTVTMPKLSPTMESGTIAKWHKKEGEHVEAGDVLLEVSTDKATVEHSALDEGWLRKILVQEGQDATVNQPIAIFTEAQDESFEGYEAAGESASATPPKEEPAKITKEEPQPEKTVHATEQARIFVSPLARKIAKEKNIDLATVQGSGPRGRIVVRDLEEQKARPGKAMPKEASGSYREIPLSQMRKIIAQRLQQAKANIPHFYVEKTIDVERLTHFREQLMEAGVKISYNDCVVKACALALKQHPVVNSGFNAQTNTILEFQTIDISIAVSLPEGLITPIVTHADHKSLTEISDEVKSLAAKAKDGKLQPHEFQGGSFTVSNLGMFGVTNFQAIINPPQSAILSVSSILDVPVIKEGKIVPGKIMNVTLSSDHRVVDGVAAAHFLNTLQKFLENPVSLLL